MSRTDLSPVVVDAIRREVSAQLRRGDTSHEEPPRREIHCAACGLAVSREAGVRVSASRADAAPDGSLYFTHEERFACGPRCAESIAHEAERRMRIGRYAPGGVLTR